MTYRQTTSWSLRDPDGALRIEDGRALRLIFPEASARFADVINTDVVRALISEGKVVATRAVSSSEWGAQQGSVYEHELAPFPSQPCEWPPAMLARAAEATLDIEQRLLPHGLTLKDATPSNIQFFGNRPVLVDVPSIVPRKPGSYLWSARQQFETTFLLPLVANLERQLPLRWSLANPVDGITHEFCAKLIGARRWMQPSLASAVALPATLNAAASSSTSNFSDRTISNDAKALFILQRSLDKLLSQIRRIESRLERRASHWNSYQSSRSHYDAADLKRKSDFVTSALASAQPATVLDVGANTGEFSVAAAAESAVVALESDEVAANSIYVRALQSDLRILPLVVDFVRPTPATGWRNAEYSSLLARASGSFDFVLMLAVVHHLRVTGGIPIAELLDMASTLTRDFLLVEFVPRADPMFRQIARGREFLYPDCERDAFHSCISSKFQVQVVEQLANGRALYLARRRTV